MNPYVRHAAPDNSQIDVNQIGEVIHWCRRLGCTQDQLRTAVATVGPLADDVRSYLGRQRHSVLAARFVNLKSANGRRSQHK